MPRLLMTSGLLSVLTVASAAMFAEAASADSETVDVTTLGAVGNGVADDTAAFRAAAATGKVIRVPRPPVHYKLTGKVRISASIIGEGSPEIRMYGANGDESRSMFEVYEYAGEGLVIRGLHLDGQWKGGTRGELSHLILVKGSKNVVIEHNLLERPYGDCILLGGEGNPRPSENITIRENEMSDPRRCNVAMISVRGVRVQNNVIKKRSKYVTAIDLEPNPNSLDAAWDVEISGNRFEVPDAVAVMLYHVPDGMPPEGPGGDVRISGNAGLASRFFVRVGPWKKVALEKNAWCADP